MQENKSHFFNECFSSVNKLANQYKDYTALLKYHIANVITNSKNQRDHVREQIDIILEKKTKEKAGFIEMLRRVEECEVIINSEKPKPPKATVKSPRQKVEPKKASYSVKRRSVSFRDIESGKSTERKSWLKEYFTDRESDEDSKPTNPNILINNDTKKFLEVEKFRHSLKKISDDKRLLR